MTRVRVPGQVALVLGLDESAYGMMRSLGRAGVRVVSLVDEDSSARLSRYCAGEISLLPFKRESPETLLPTLLARRPEFDACPVLFSNCDWFVLALAKHRAELAPHYLYHWVAPELLASCVDKARLPELCQRAGILAPRTHVTRTGENVADAAREFPFPCIVKPTVNFNPYFVDFKNFVARSPSQLVEFYARCPVQGTSVWQELIEGGDDTIHQCTVLRSSSGELSAVATVRKLLQYPANGMMCHGRTEPNPEIVEQTARFLACLGYTGLASLEFKRSERDGRYYFVEMNPRLPWYNGIFADAGVNLPLAAYRDLRGQPVRQTPQRDGVHWLSGERTLRRQVGSRGALAGSLAVLGAAARSRSFAWWNWRDPLPWIGASWRLAAAAAAKLLRAGMQRVRSHAT